MSKNMVNIKINGKPVQIKEGSTVLEAAKSVNIDIPTLCYLKDVNKIGACRMCVIEIKNARALQAACVYPVSEGLEIETNSPRVRKARKTTLELILSNHDRNCLTCVRSRTCELQALAEQLGVQSIRYEGESNKYEVDKLSPSIVRDPNKCILCRRCESVCRDIQKVSVIGASERGFNSKVGCVFDKSINEVPCTNCGQCIMVCPVGALHEKDDTERVWLALEDKTKHVVVQTAPAVRIALGEEFGMPIGTKVTGKMVAALKSLGFAGVFDTDTAADFTIMEEGTEFIQRMTGGGKLPLITSCSPGWVKFCEHNYPEFLDNLSTAKSPHEMMGALLKTYYAEKNNINPADIVVVSIMPCSAKKFEAEREELSGGGYPDVDIVLTTRECARMIKQVGIDFASLDDAQFDMPFGEGSGAGVIFGATGGVMEAALRTVADTLSGETVWDIEYNQIRGTKGIKEAELEIAGRKVKIAVVNGLGNAREIMDRMKRGEAEYHFIEIMGCPGGCVTGGGQPIVSANMLMDMDVKKERAKTLYKADRELPVRKSHQNEVVQQIYKEFLGEPNGHKAHELLHTHYHKRENY